MRVISLSADGVYAASEQGLYEWLAGQDAEIICLQDLRARAYELEDDPTLQLDGYFAYFFDGMEGQANGVAIYTRSMPKAIMYGFGLASGEDMNGRYLQADFERLSVISMLCPTAFGNEEQRHLRREFMQGLQNHLLKISRKNRDYIFCANLQVPHTDADSEQPETTTEDSEALAEERLWLDQLYSEIGYQDGFRAGNGDADEYSWWPSGSIGEGYGQRADTQIVSQSLASRIEYAVLYKAKTFSSHTPVIVDYDIETL